MRIELTKDKADALLAGRVAAGMSQYELADALGWPRAKVKRLERGETATIQEEDLRAMEAVFRRTPSSRSQQRGGLMAEQLFSRVKRLGRRDTENQVYFRVKMRVGMEPLTLSGMALELDGIKGRVHGVEHSSRQVPLRIGDELVIMLWGKGIGPRGKRKRSV